MTENILQGLAILSLGGLALLHLFKKSKLSYPIMVVLVAYSLTFIL